MRDISPGSGLLSVIRTKGESCMILEHVRVKVLIITAMGPLGHHSKGTTRSSPNGTTRSSL